jgi:hypothetical protein
MAEFKKEIAKTDFKATQKTVQGDAMGSFKAAAAETVGSLAKGVGQGYATGKGEQQLGTDESAAEANAYVSEAFKTQQAPKAQSGYETHYTEGNTVLSTDAPTKEEVEGHRASVLSTASMNDKRIQAALDQGRISSREANDHRIKNRKEFMANPINALFGAHYDNAIGGGASGASRGAFFGKTAQEKAQEKLVIEEMTEQRNDQRAADNLMKINPNLTPKRAMSMVQGQKGRLLRLQHLQTKNSLELLGEGEAVEMYQSENIPVYSKLHQDVLQLVDLPEGAKASAVSDFITATTLQQAAIAARIDNSSMGVEAKKQEHTELIRRFDLLRSNVEDTSFVERLKRDTAQADAEIANSDSAHVLGMIRFSDSYSLTHAIAVEGESPLAVMKYLGTSADMSTADVFKLKGREDLKAIRGYMDELSSVQRVKAADAALAKVLKGGAAPSMTGPEAATIGAALQQKNIPTVVAAAYKEDPLGVGEKLNAAPNVDLTAYAGSREYQGLVRTDPDFVNALFDSAIEDARMIQMSQRGTLPDRITVTREAPTRGSVTDGRRPTNWVFDSGGVKLKGAYKGQVVGMHRLAEQNPSMWNKEYVTLEDYINSKAAAVAVEPQSEEAVKKARAEMEAAAKVESKAGPKIQPDPVAGASRTARSGSDKAGPKLNKEGYTPRELGIRGDYKEGAKLMKEMELVNGEWRPVFDEGE